MVENICAKATPYGASAIAIIRCSGPDAIILVNKIFKGCDLSKVSSHTMHYGRIVDGKEIIDEVLCNVFIAPTSYDGENMVEINCHGGVLVTGKILQLLLKIGFRMAEPGEFSKRAFLNHKLDLTQAEAIMDVIHAENTIALRAGQNALRQSTTKLITSFREKLLDVLAKIEVNIDYPEYEDSIEITREYLLPVLEVVQKDMKKILQNSKISNLAIHGIHTVIIGKPNVGKSSLLNMLLDEDKAIVTDVPGTTRDIIEGSFTIGDLTLHLMDTAGIHQSLDMVEKIGIERSTKAMESADLVLVVVDASKPLEQEDYDILESAKNKPTILIGNKQDQGITISREDDLVLMSAKHHQGLEALIAAIKKVTQIQQFNVDEDKFLANQRQIHFMQQAADAIDQAQQACFMGMDIDLVEIDIKRAFDALGAITGDASPEELITALFTKFCLGK